MKLAYIGKINLLQWKFKNKKKKEDSRVSFISEGLSDGPGNLVWRGLL